MTPYRSREFHNRFRRLAMPEPLEDRAAPGGGLLGIFWGAPVVEWVLGSLWTDGRTAAQVAPPSVGWHRAEYLDALVGFYADPGRLGLLLGEARQLMSITAVDDAMADWYLETARSRILEVAADLAQPGVVDLGSADFAGRLWWVDQFFMGLARSEMLGGISGELSLEGDDLDGGVTMDYGGYGGYPPIAQPDTYEADHSTAGFTYVLDVPYPGVKWNDGDPYHPLSTLTVSTVSGPSHAQYFTLNSDGSFVYKPAAYYRSNYTPDTFVYRLTNPEGLYSQAQVSIYVHNNVPVAVNDQYMVHATIPPTSLVVPGQQGLPTVLANDGEADVQDREGLTVERYADVQHGTLALDPSGTFTYTPVEGYVGFDTFSYRVTDGMDWSGPATVTINVYNNPPIVENDGPYYIGFVDDGPAEPLIVSEPGVLGNDHDPDGDYPLTAIRVSDPSHGTLEYFHPEGDFKYIPDPGFTGEDSFQYVANDGIADSLFVATVQITTYRVDLMIYDGQTGAQVAYPEEESRGAFTVANKNDTDGDGAVDNVDVNGVVATPAGRNEVDLMRLDIARPYAGFEGAVTLTVPSGVIILWKESTKVTRVNVDDFGMVQFTEADFPPTGDKTVWAEVFSPSTSVRDLSMVLSYWTHTDTVNATGVWAEKTAVAHDTRSYNDLINDPVWSDMGTPPANVIALFGGVGLRPIGPLTGIHNVIAFQFSVYPYGITLETNVRFDVARDVEGKRSYKLVPGGPWFEDANLTRTFEQQVELPNDDAGEADESAAPTVYRHMYSVDPPGPGGFDNYLYDKWRYNFYEWIRVSVDGTDPAGNAIAGSRASDKALWSVAHSLERVGGVWQRNTGDDPETVLNHISEEHIDIA